MAPLLLLALAGAVLGWTSCSAGESDPASTTVPSADATTLRPAPPTPSSDTEVTPLAPSSPPSPTLHAPPVAEAEGWRFQVLHPRAGARLGRSMTICSEISGTSREPALVIEAALLPSGAADGLDARADIDVGRGSAVLDFLEADPGRHDLVLHLLVDGQRVPELRVTVPNLAIAEDASSGDCD